MNVIFPQSSKLYRVTDALFESEVRLPQVLWDTFDSLRDSEFNVSIFAQQAQLPLHEVSSFLLELQRKKLLFDCTPTLSFQESTESRNQLRDDLAVNSDEQNLRQLGNKSHSHEGMDELMGGHVPSVIVEMSQEEEVEIF